MRPSYFQRLAAGQSGAGGTGGRPLVQPPRALFGATAWPARNAGPEPVPATAAARRRATAPERAPSHPSGPVTPDALNLPTRFATPDPLAVSAQTPATPDRPPGLSAADPPTVPTQPLPRPVPSAQTGNAAGNRPAEAADAAAIAAPPPSAQPAPPDRQSVVDAAVVGPAVRATPGPTPGPAPWLSPAVEALRHAAGISRTSTTTQVQPQLAPRPDSAPPPQERTRVAAPADSVASPSPPRDQGAEPPRQGAPAPATQTLPAKPRSHTPLLQPPRAPAISAPAEHPAPAQPRIEIGTVEVRLPAPAPRPVRAPAPPAAGPLPRRGTYPFGLSQG
ncbi:hypothetical protein [uncultured Thiodictyon sp.]|uniref:hypothetical protein n=1 Tax=uncultured Thiodictyon sp. TaxID=1846217 RepID=UPI0025D17839|nr:hypothetical protein [uncultured Thiodictyon sp.]